MGPELKRSMAKPYNPTASLTADRSLPRAKAKGAGRLRLQTLSQLDQRTLAAKRAHQLVRSICRDLTGDDDESQLSEATRQLVQAAAVLGAIIESSATAWLSGDPVDLPGYYTAINSQRRLLTTLGLERRAKDVSMNLAQHQAMKRERERVLAAEAKQIEADVDEAAQ
jgi:hypothetical protein